VTGQPVLTDGLANVVDLVKHGRSTYQRVLTWIVNKISRTILKAGFVVIAFLVTGKFVISVRTISSSPTCARTLRGPRTEQSGPSPKPADPIVLDHLR
jgi:hypothetical protein